MEEIVVKNLIKLHKHNVKEKSVVSYPFMARWRESGGKVARWRESGGKVARWRGRTLLALRNIVDGYPVA